MLRTGEVGGRGDDVFICGVCTCVPLCAQRSEDSLRFPILHSLPCSFEARSLTDPGAPVFSWKPANPRNPLVPALLGVGTASACGTMFNLYRGVGIMTLVLMLE